jgi:pimeloyl-ACP methyl ester carboxylesterase
LYKLSDSLLSIVVEKSCLVPSFFSVFAMQGMADAVVGVSHGRQLHALCQTASEPLWAEGCGHDDVETCPAYVPTLKRFLRECFGDRYTSR